MNEMDDSKKRKSRSYDDEETSGIYALLSLSAVAKNARRKKNLSAKGDEGKARKAVGGSSVSPSKRRETKGVADTGQGGKDNVPPSLKHVQRSMEHVLDRFDTRMFCMREFFYSEADRAWSAGKQDGMQQMVDCLGLGREALLQADEWWAIRSLLGKKPRRLSKSFLHDSRVDLHLYRKEYYAKAGSLAVAQRVSAIHPESLEIHDGVILSIVEDSCRVQFDRADVGVHVVPKYAVVAKPEAKAPAAAAAGGGEGRRYEMPRQMEKKSIQVLNREEILSQVNDVYRSSVKTIELNKHALGGHGGRCLLHQPSGIQNPTNQHIQRMIHEVARVQGALADRIKAHVRTLLLLRMRPEMLSDLKTSLHDTPLHS